MSRAVHALVAVRQDVYEKNPWIAGSLYQAFDASKNWALERLRISAAQHSMLPFMFADMDEVDELFDGDPWPYGIEPNRPTLEALVRHLKEQHFISETPPIKNGHCIRAVSLCLWAMHPLCTMTLILSASH